MKRTILAAVVLAFGGLIGVSAQAAPVSQQVGIVSEAASADRVEKVQYHSRWRSHHRFGSRHNRWRSHNRSSSYHHRWRSHSRWGSRGPGHSRWRSHHRWGSRRY